MIASPNENDSSNPETAEGSTTPQPESPSSDPSKSTLVDESTLPRSSGEAPKTWPIGLILDDRYFIEKELGHGGIGAVYLARDRKLHDRLVVVKVLLEKSLRSERILEKFQQEKEALSRVDHPGIIGILDNGNLPDGNPYIVMQYVSGVNLRAVLSPEGLDLMRTAGIIGQLGNALAAAHGEGIYHRDLKPENIMLQGPTPGEEQVRVIDFGVAKVTDSRVALSTVTPTTLGTYGYMSPEQFRGERVTAASDVYSLGAIAYEMVTGRRPLNPETVGQLGEMQRQGVRIRPRDLRPALPEAAQEVILKALSFEPRSRYQSAREFGDSFSLAVSAGVESGMSPSSEQVSPVNLLAVLTRARPTTLIAIAVIIVAALLVTVWATFLREPANRSDVPSSNAPPVSAGKSITNSLGMEFVHLPAGSFLMGSTNGEHDEQPPRTVDVESFYLGRCEVTQAQWQAVMRTNPSHFRGADRPVDNISWDEIQEFIKKLHAMGDGYTYRLPTESEWEYACRAGSTGDFAGDLDLMAWYANNSGRQRLDADEIWRTDRDNYAQRLAANASETHPVRQKQPNAFGLYDMHGNAWEWCADYYHQNYIGAPTDGGAWLSGGDMNYRVMRGGSRASIRERCRCAIRKLSAPSGHGNDVGFRIVAMPIGHDAAKTG